MGTREPSNHCAPDYGSWGRLRGSKQVATVLTEMSKPLPLKSDRHTSILPYGNGRSYGDSCLNDGGLLLDCRALNGLISFDKDTGVLRCETGMMLSAILDLVVPMGWFPAVTPGTKYVTVGGAIANDVHGKNHHVKGTFGAHVRRFELLRSDGNRLLCSANENSELFAATIGGLGLTGLITWAELQLMPVDGTVIAQDVVRFRSLDEFADMVMTSDAAFEYSVAWLDSLATGRALGRGLFIRGNHVPGRETSNRAPSRKYKVPFVPPVSLINRASLRVFNSAYYHRQWSDHKISTVHYDPFFYPLDGILQWNRLYGPNGLFQHQCIVPVDNGGIDCAIDVVRNLLERTQRADIGSFLTVLKLFGDVPSPGLLSFPKPGLTLTLDFANTGAKTYALLDELDDVVLQVGGRVNPYKDARMSGENFRKFFPQWNDLKTFIDPEFSSSFWRRVTGAGV